MTSVTTAQLASTTTPQGVSLVGYMANATGSVGRTELAKWQEHSVLTPEDFGAIGDGSSDDTTALQNWLAAGGAGTVLTLGPKTYVFKSPLSTAASRVSIVGQGIKSVLLYAGANTNIDLLTFGNGSAEMNGCRLARFKVDSATQMASGHALMFKLLTRSRLDDVVIGGQDGSYNLYDGAFYQGFDVVIVSGHDTRVRNNGVKACSKPNGGTNSYVGYGADLYLIGGGKIGGCGASGVWVGGGCGGVILEDVDVIASGQNVAGSPGVRIDTALNGIENREVYFGGSFAADSTNGPGVLVNDSLVGTNGPGWIQSNGGWFASSQGGYANFEVQNWGHSGGQACSINFTGGTIYNGSAIGLHSSTSIPIITIRGTVVRYNTTYGVAGGANINIQSPIWYGNGSGNISGAAFETAGVNQAVINSLGFTPPNQQDPFLYGTTKLGSSAFTAGTSGSTATLQFAPNTYIQSDGSRINFYVGGVCHFYIDSTGYHTA